jgi:hypothetical protein
MLKRDLCSPIAKAVPKRRLPTPPAVEDDAAEMKEKEKGNDEQDKSQSDSWSIAELWTLADAAWSLSTSLTAMFVQGLVFGMSF